MCLISPLKMYPAERLLNLLFELLPVRIWRFPARLNFTFPVAVNLKRLAAAFLVFIFVIDVNTYDKSPSPVKRNTGPAGFKKGAFTARLSGSS